MGYKIRFNLGLYITMSWIDSKNQLIGDDGFLLYNGDDAANLGLQISV